MCHRRLPAPEFRYEDREDWAVAEASDNAIQL